MATSNDKAGARRNVGPLAKGTTEIRVCYRDTDQMGHVYYANFLVYFEIARTELLRTLGRSYRECEESGVFLPVIEASCRYLERALYDDLLRIETRVTRWTRASLDFAHECRRAGDDTLLAEGVTRHAFTNREGRVVRAGADIVPLPHDAKPEESKP